MTMSTPSSVTEEFLVTPEILACPYDYYRRVRDEAPVHQTPLGFWSVSRYDVERVNARSHLAFGQGAHFCVGAALARSEARIGFELLLNRMHDIALAQMDHPTDRELSMTLRGMSALHLTFDAAPTMQEPESH